MVQQSDVQTLSGIVSGSGILSQTGDSVLTLANTYNGGLLWVTAGTLQIPSTTQVNDAAATATGAFAGYCQGGLWAYGAVVNMQGTYNKTGLGYLLDDAGVVNVSGNLTWGGTNGVRIYDNGVFNLTGSATINLPSISSFNVGYGTANGNGVANVSGGTLAVVGGGLNVGFLHAANGVLNIGSGPTGSVG